ncbi:MAG: hypothetical protein KBG70_07800 [Chitinophagales bacterium]|jgi:predicted nucleic acid-binding protein|nr:hypothetical protein [Chitinophagales bacterium]
MKHRFTFIVAVLIIISCFSTKAQHGTKITITDIDPALAQKMEQSASGLLTEFNNAFYENRIPDLKIKGLSNEGKSSILSMWETTNFRCVKPEIIEKGYSTPTGYQVRNIPLFLKDMPEDESYKEIVINYNSKGEIYDIYFAIDYHHYQEILKSEDNEVSDLRRRQVILDFVENFRTAYNRKDITFLEKVYSDDALIITGKVVKIGQPSEVMSKNLSLEKIEYQVKTKTQYLDGLRKVFKNNTKINIIFDEIEVARHPRYDEIYGITLRQGWNTTNYSDIGYVFLMIDFKDDSNPIIHVRTWQPEKLNGNKLKQDEIFSLGSFEII